jgi:hypothetical protein
MAGRKRAHALTIEDVRSVVNEAFEGLTERLMKRFDRIDARFDRIDACFDRFEAKSNEIAARSSEAAHGSRSR